MSEIMQRKGSREEHVRELRALAEGWDHVVKPTLAEQASAAGANVESGADSAQAGHTLYIVTD